MRLAFGTDYDVEPISPFRGLYACVTRELPTAARKAAGSRRKKSRWKIAFVPTPAAQPTREFEEGKKGELKAGEFADFIILSNDLTKVPPREYTKTKVLRTVVGGRTVYSVQ